MSACVSVLAYTLTGGTFCNAIAGATVSTPTFRNAVPQPW